MIYKYQQMECAVLQAECDEQCSRILEQLHAERLLDHKVSWAESGDGELDILHRSRLSPLLSTLALPLAPSGMCSN